METYFNELKDQHKLLKRMCSLEVDHEPDGWPAVQMKDISALCKLVENLIPAIGLLEARLERGEYLKKINGTWWLFEADGNDVAHGKTLRDILIALIFKDC